MSTPDYITAARAVEALGAIYASACTSVLDAVLHLDTVVTILREHAHLPISICPLCYGDTVVATPEGDYEDCFKCASRGLVVTGPTPVTLPEAVAIAHESLLSTEQMRHDGAVRRAKMEED